MPGLFDWNLKILKVDIKFSKLGLDKIDILWYNLKQLIKNINRKHRIFNIVNKISNNERRR